MLSSITETKDLLLQKLSFVGDKLDLEQLKAALSKALEKVDGKIPDSAKEKVQSTIKSLEELIQYEKLKESAANNFNKETLKHYYEDAFSKIDDLRADLQSYTTSKYGQVNEIAKEKYGQVNEIAKEKYGQVNEIAKEKYEQASDKYDQINEFTHEKIEKVLEALADVQKGLVESAKGKFENFKETVQPYIPIIKTKGVESAVFIDGKLHVIDWFAYALNLASQLDANRLGGNVQKKVVTPAVVYAQDKGTELDNKFAGGAVTVLLTDVKDDFVSKRKAAQCEGLEVDANGVVTVGTN